jgi:hypothetical protein
MKALARILVLATLWWLGPLAGDVASAAEPASMSPPPRELSTMADRERVTLPPMTVPLDPPARDLRPFYVGLGLIVMATAFWWNRRQRDRFEREDDRVRHGRPPRTRPRPARDTAAAPGAAGARDDDADDLHAAARGDTPDPPDRPAP